MEPEREPSPRNQVSLWPVVLLGALFALSSLFRSSRYRAQKATKGEHPKETPADKCRQANPFVLSDTQPTPPQRHPRYRGKDDTPKWKKWIEIVVAASTAGLLLINVVLWCSTRQAIRISTRQLEMTDRPWIKDTILSAADMGWQHGSYLGWAVTLQADNVGHSVATGLFPEVNLLAIDGADFTDYPRREANKLCDVADAHFDRVKNDPIAWGTSAFPEESRTFPGYNVWLMPSEVDKKSFDGGAELGKSVFPMLVGCIVYHYPSSGRPHHTWFVYALTHIDDETLAEPTRVFFGVGKNVPKDKVVLTKVGQFAD